MGKDKMQKIVVSLAPPLIYDGSSMVVATNLLQKLIVANVVCTNENL